MRILFGSIAIVLTLATQAFAGPKEDLAVYARLAGEGQAAMKAGNMKAAEVAFRAASAQQPQRSTILYTLASVLERQGKHKAALGVLAQFAARGLVADPAADADFAALKSDPAFSALAAQIKQSASPLCRCTTVYQGTPAPFIAEGIAHDAARNRILVAGIYTRSIIAIRDGQAADFIAPLPDGLSPFALAIAGQTLWVAGGVMPQGNSNAPPLAALLAFDLATGQLQHSYKEASGTVKAFGDIALGHDGTIYLSDGDGGSIYRLKPGVSSLERIGAGGQMVSPQGMVERPDGKMLLVADYALGLVRLDLATGEIAAVAAPKDATTLVIDGVAQIGAREFVATQNGIQPARIVRFALNADWSAVTRFDVIARAAPEIADPSLIAPDGDGVLLVGVGQWAAFDADAPQPVRPLAAYRIVRLTL